LRPGSWTRPAGESPVRVGARAPGSRPRLGGESPQAERGVKCLFGGSKNVGRSRKASPAASSQKQWGSRAAHVTAKATSNWLKRDCQLGSSGVGGAARCVLRSCDGLAGESPVEVMTKQPRSWWPAEGETRLSKRHDKVAFGGEQVLGPYVKESCCVEIPKTWEPNRTCRGEGHGRCQDLGSAAPTTHRRKGEWNEHRAHHGTGEIRLGTGVQGCDLPSRGAR